MMSFDLSAFSKDIGVEMASSLSGEAYPLEKWSPQSCGKMNMQIKANGDWWHNNSEIKRDKLILLFSKVLCVDEGVHCLKTPVEKIEIEVEDAAFIVIDYRVDGNQLTLVTNIGDVVDVSSRYPLLLTNGILYLSLWRGLKAKVSRNVYYDLVELALAQGGERDNRLWLSSGDECFCLGVLN